MKKIPYSKFKHGQRVTYVKNNVKINDAKISINKNGMIYLCNNKNVGLIDADDKLGYNYSYSFLCYNENYNSEGSTIKNLKLLDRTLDDIEEGDVLVDECGDEQKVLGICGNVYFLSEENDFKKVSEYYYTTQELENNGYTLKQDIEEEEKEMVGLTVTKEMMGNTLYINPDITLSPQDVEKIVYKGKTYILSK